MREIVFRTPLLQSKAFRSTLPSNIWLENPQLIKECYLPKSITTEICASSFEPTVAFYSDKGRCQTRRGTRKNSRGPNDHIAPIRSMTNVHLCPARADLFSREQPTYTEKDWITDCGATSKLTEDAILLHCNCRSPPSRCTIAIAHWTVRNVDFVFDSYTGYV